MDYGTFCSRRETFGISINKDLLTTLNTTNCTYVDGTNNSNLISLSLRILTGLSWLSVALVGTTANVSVLFVIACIKSMRTIPNWLLFNLAVADCLMTLVALPILGVFQTFFYPIWQMPYALCFVLNCFTHIGALASGASLAAISVHRFLVIRFPRRFEITKKHLIITICIIWIIAVAGSASSMSSAGVIGMIRPVAGRMCLTRLCIQVNPTNQREQVQLAFRCSMYLTFALFLFLLYTNIGLLIYRSKSPGLEITAEASAVCKRQAIRMLTVATVVMIFSYLPYMVLVSRILFAQPGYYSPVFAVEILCNIISGLNHVVNPFIYCALSLQFREGFKKYFASLRRKRHSIAPETQVRQQQRNMSTAVALNVRRDSNSDGKPDSCTAIGRLATWSSQLSFQVLLSSSSEASLRKVVPSKL